VIEGDCIGYLSKEQLAMGSAISVTSLREHEQNDVIDKCAMLYANDPMYFEYIVAEAKKKSIDQYYSQPKSSRKEESITTASSGQKSEQGVDHKSHLQDSHVSAPALSKLPSSEAKAADIPPTVTDSDTKVKGNSMDLISTINRVRMNPVAFVEDLEKHLSKFIDETVFQLKYDGKTINIRTNEGKAAVISAIEFLKQKEAVPPIQYSPLLEKAAVDHVRDISDHGISGHEVRHRLC
jgi:hypothetical protein